MAKILKVVLLLIVLSFSLCQDKSQCSESGLYNCPSNATCCPDSSSPTGYRCYPIKSGNCCDNNIVCPQFASCPVEGSSDCVVSTQ